ncbi:hypothetical protein [Nocardioides dongkuii]|nr:hypothetical protein [Nocardioides dongkuii]
MNRGNLMFSAVAMAENIRFSLRSTAAGARSAGCRAATASAVTPAMLG